MRPIFYARNCFQQQKQAASRLMLLLLIGLLLPWLPSASLALPVQPELLQLARTHPQATVAVIIQKHPQAPDLAQQIAQLGGQVTKNLDIIQAVAAELPVRQVLRLAALPSVRWVSLDGPVVQSVCAECLDTTQLQNTYVRAVNADKVWNSPPYLQGQNVTVAVVDSGVYESQDLRAIDNQQSARILAAERFNSNTQNGTDQYGHGTHIAGIIAGNGARSAGIYIGVAPRANLVNIKVTDEVGMATESDVVAGLQWIYANYKTYNIRVVNLSLNGSTPQSYHTSPLAAACEVLWFNGIVVVVSAGNNGTATLYPPANDPFVITVGAVDDQGTDTLQDDQIAAFSAYGSTKDGFAKPDLVAPGRNIVSLLANSKNVLVQEHPDHAVYTAHAYYFRMSGTSVAAPIVAGAAALLLQDEPNLTPDQVKYRLLATANQQWPGYDRLRAGAGYLDVAAAVRGTTTQAANTKIPVSNLLTTGPNGVLSPSVNWSSVNWSSVNWSSVNWSSVNWSSDYWEATPIASAAPVPSTTTSARETKAKAAPVDHPERLPISEQKVAQPYRLFMPMILKTN